MPEKREKVKEFIMDYLSKKGASWINELYKITGVGKKTLYKALDELIKEGKVVSFQDGGKKYIALPSVTQGNGKKAGTDTEEKSNTIRAEDGVELESVPGLVRLDPDDLMKLEWLSDATGLDPSEIIKRLVNKLYNTLTPVVVPNSKIEKNGEFYEVDIKNLENIKFNRLSMLFRDFGQALVVARSFNRQNCIAVVSRERGGWAVYYEVPDPADPSVEVVDFIGRRISIRVGNSD